MRNLLEQISKAEVVQLALLPPSQILQYLGAIEQNFFEIAGGSRGISFLEFHNRMTISSEIQ